MKKNAFLTFLFALVPGCGQMYQSYMKRGLSLMLLFAVNVFLVSIVGLAGIFLPVIWAYSFFDTYHLRTGLELGTAPADTFLFSDGSSDGILTAFLSRRHVLVGWALVLTGGWLIFDRFILRTLRDIAERYDLWEFYSVLYRAPTLLVALILVVLGIMLVRGKGLAKPKDDFVAFPEPEEEDEEDDDE